MNIASPLLLALALTSFASAAPMKDRVTGQELSQRRMAQASPVSTLAQPVDGKRAEVERPGNESIISNSVILTDGTNWTIVPRGAVLHIPAKHENKIGKRPVGNLLSWNQFVAANRAWISSEEVTLRQAEGVHKLDERRIAFWPKQDKIIVATHLGGPISVVEPTVETAANF